MAITNRLEVRIRSILAAGAKRGPASQKVRAAALALAGCVALGFGLVRVVGGQQTPTQSASQPVMAYADNPIATLPNGSTVSLLGLGVARKDNGEIIGYRAAGHEAPPAPAKGWWRPDGSSQQETFISKVDDSFSVAPDGPVGRWFEIQIGYDKSAQPSITRDPGAKPPDSFQYGPLEKSGKYYAKPVWSVRVQPGAIERTGFGVTWSSPNTTDGLTVSAAFDTEDKSCTVRFGTAAGPWTWSTTLPNRIGDTIGDARIQTPAGELLVTQITDPKSIYVGSGFKRGDLAIMFSDVYALDHPAIGKPRVAGVPTYDRRLLALDSQGRVVADLGGNMNPTYMGGDGSWIYNTHYLTSAQRKQIAVFRLVMRPFQWAEFRGVQLYPKSGA